MKFNVFYFASNENVLNQHNGKEDQRRISPENDIKHKKGYYGAGKGIMTNSYTK